MCETAILNGDMSRPVWKWGAWGIAGLMISAAPSTPQTSAADVIAHLEQTIAWYRHVTAAQESAIGSSDVLLLDSTHQASTQALQLAFDFAKAEMALISGAGGNVESIRIPAWRRIGQPAASLSKGRRPREQPCVPNCGFGCPDSEIIGPRPRRSVRSAKGTGSGARLGERDSSHDSESGQL